MLGRKIVSEQLKLHLYVSELQLKWTVHWMTDQLHNLRVEGTLTDEEVDERPIITWPTDILTEIVLSQLNAEVPFESKPENYGINNFIKSKEIIALFVWFFIFKETMLNISYKAVDYRKIPCRQILASSSPNNIVGYVFPRWKVKYKSNLFQSKTLFHAWSILVLTLFINRLLSLR